MDSTTQKTSPAVKKETPARVSLSNESMSGQETVKKGNNSVIDLLDSSDDSSDDEDELMDWLSQRGTFERPSVPRQPRNRAGNSTVDSGITEGIHCQDTNFGLEAGRDTSLTLNSAVGSTHGANTTSDDDSDATKLSNGDDSDATDYDDTTKPIVSSRRTDSNSTLKALNNKTIHSPAKKAGYPLRSSIDRGRHFNLRDDSTDKMGTLAQDEFTSIPAHDMSATNANAAYGLEDDKAAKALINKVMSATAQFKVFSGRHGAKRFIDPDGNVKEGKFGFSHFPDVDSALGCLNKTLGRHENRKYTKKDKSPHFHVVGCNRQKTHGSGRCIRCAKILMLRPNDWVIIIGKHDHNCQTQGHTSEDITNTHSQVQGALSELKQKKSIAEAKLVHSLANAHPYSRTTGQNLPNGTTRHLNDDEIQTKINCLMLKGNNGQYNRKHGARPFVDPKSESSDSHCCSHFASETEALQCVNKTLGARIGAVFKKEKSYPEKSGRPFYTLATHNEFGVKIACLYPSYWIVILGGNVPIDSTKKRPAETTENDGTRYKRSKTAASKVAAYSDEDEDEDDDDDDDYSINGDQINISVRGRKAKGRQKSEKKASSKKAQSTVQGNDVAARSTASTKSTPRTKSSKNGNSKKSPPESARKTKQNASTVDPKAPPNGTSNNMPTSKEPERPVAPNDAQNRLTSTKATPTPVSSIANWIISDVFDNIPSEKAKLYAEEFVKEDLYSPSEIMKYLVKEYFRGKRST